MRNLQNCMHGSVPTDSLIVKKTDYIVFHSKQNKYTPHAMNIYINGSLINEVVKTKFLGIFMGNALSWKYHLDYIYTKLAKVHIK